MVDNGLSSCLYCCGATFCAAYNSCPPVDRVTNDSYYLVPEIWGYDNTALRDFVGAVVSTILRNVLSTSVIRKTVLVSVVGDIAASKLVERSFSIVLSPVDAIVVVGPLFGAPNAA